MKRNKGKNISFSVLSFCPRKSKLKQGVHLLYRISNPKLALPLEIQEAIQFSFNKYFTQCALDKYTSVTNLLVIVLSL